MTGFERESSATRMSTHSVSAPEREQRINIIHVDLDAAPLPGPFGRSGEECLVVFWRDEVPLAHTYARTDRDGTLPLADLIAGFTPIEVGIRAHAAAPSRAPSVSLVICTRDRPQT